MVRRIVIALAAASLAALPAVAQGPRINQAPAGQVEIPGPTSEIVGPEGSFRLQPDGVTWERFQSIRSIGVRCTEKSCGGDRVFCMIQVRTSENARAGSSTSASDAAEFGGGVLKTAPKELKAEYVTPFAEAWFGGNVGQWAEVKAEGEPGSLRFGLFLTNANKRLVAFNCVSPSDKWATNKPKFEGLLASLQIAR